MNNRRNIAITAAVACALSAPLAIEPRAAQADELSDLRANQQLLQERIDQLSQALPGGGGPGTIYPGGPPSPVAGQPSAAGSFPRSFLVPGTDTSIRVGGQIRENAIYYFNGGPPNSSPQSTTVGDNGQANAIPVKISLPSSVTSGATYSRSTDIFLQSPRESKVNFETRTPTAWGEVRTFMEFDWAGSTSYAPQSGVPLSSSDNLVPRLKYAYGTMGGLLAGQANSNFSDPDANGETIDFGGNVGEPGIVRVPQVRYTVPLQPWGFLGAFSVSAEAPETDAWLPTSGIIGSDSSAIGGGTVTTTNINPSTGAAITETAIVAAPLANPLKAGAPDLTAAWYIPQPWGHVDYSLVWRPAMQINDGALVNKTYMGYGLHTSFDVKPGWFGWAKDDIIFHAIWGDGIGRYNNDTSGFALTTTYPLATPTTRVIAGSVLARTTVSWGGEVGYQHSWLDNLRSNWNAGIYYHDINDMRGAVCGFSLAAGSAAQAGSGGCGLDKQVVTAHANLIWNPVPFVDLSIEYIYGHRVVLSNLRGDMNVLESRMAVSF